MNVYLTDQSTKLQSHLEMLKSLPLMPYDPVRLVEKTTTIEINSPFRVQKLDTRFLFSYHIFPRNAMTHLTEWEHERRAMRLGDTIVQQVYLPPLSGFSVKIIVGVRIAEIIDEPTRKGFRYQTVAGHIEQGSAEFILEQSERGRIRFRVHTFSRPANVLARLVRPIISVPYQTFLTRLALENVKRQVELQQ